MAAASEISGDIAAAGSAIAGLLLVYVGSLSASFGGFQPQEKRSVKAAYQRRAWFALIGLLLCLGAVGGSILGKWLCLSWLTIVSLALLLAGLGWVAVTGVLTVWEID